MIRTSCFVVSRNRRVIQDDNRGKVRCGGGGGVGEGER